LMSVFDPACAKTFWDCGVFAISAAFWQIFRNST
jgi:hypothetical protein